jgi:hypothetical protein
MKDFYIRFGRRFPIPPTVQIKHEIMHIVLAERDPPQQPADLSPLKPTA